jgi:hypothetical protein
MGYAPTTLARGNVTMHWVASVTLSPASVGVTTIAEQSFTVLGLKLGDFVDVTAAVSNVGLSIANARVSANDTLAIAFANITAATITPTASGVYTVYIARPENLSSTNTSALSGGF